MDLTRTENDVEKGLVIAGLCAIGAVALCLVCYIRKCFI